MTHTHTQNFLSHQSRQNGKNTLLILLSWWGTWECQKLCCGSLFILSLPTFYYCLVDHCNNKRKKKKKKKKTFQPFLIFEDLEHCLWIPPYRSMTRQEVHVHHTYKSFAVTISQKFEGTQFFSSLLHLIEWECMFLQKVATADESSAEVFEKR